MSICPGPCDHCGRTVSDRGNLTRGDICDACANPRPQRPHPKRCFSCHGWSCTHECAQRYQQMAVAA